MAKKHINKIYSLIFAVVFLAVAISTTIVPCYALGSNVPVFEMKIGRPSISDNNGYIEVLFENPDSKEQNVKVFTWFTNAAGTYVDQTWCEVSFTNTTITLSPGYHIYDNTDLTDGSCGCRLNYFWASSTEKVSSCGVLEEYYHFTPQKVTFSNNGWNIKGINFYGNYHLNTSFTSSRYEFTVLYSEEYTEFNQLVDLTQALYNIEGITDASVTLIGDILQSNNDISTKLDTVISNLASIQSSNNAINNKLTDIKNWVYDSNVTLHDILDTLRSFADKSPPPVVNKDNLNGYENDEKNLLNGSLNDFNSNWQDNVNFDINTNANSLIWNIVESVGFSNPKVSALFFVVLAVSLIALILAR